MSNHSVGQAIAWWAVVVLLFVPCVPLARLWLTQATHSRLTALERTTLIIATCSQAVIISSLISTSGGHVLGHSYSVYTNLLVMLLLSVVVMIRSRALRWRLGFPCLWLCGSWLYILVISSAV